MDDDDDDDDLDQFSLEREMFQTKVVEKSQNTYFMFNDFSPENHSVCDVVGKNMVEPEKPQTTIKYCACALHAG